MQGGQVGSGGGHPATPQAERGGARGRHLPRGFSSHSICLCTPSRLHPWRLPAGLARKTQQADQVCILRGLAQKLDALCRHKTQLKARLLDEEQLLAQSSSMYETVRSLGTPTVIPLSVVGAPPLVAMPQGYAAVIPPQMVAALVSGSSTLLAMAEQRVINVTAELDATERLLREAAHDHTTMQNYVWLNRKRGY